MFCKKSCKTYSYFFGVMPVAKWSRLHRSWSECVKGLVGSDSGAGALWCVCGECQGTVAGVNGLGIGVGRRGNFGTRVVGACFVLRIIEITAHDCRVNFLKPQGDCLLLCISCFPVMICKELLHATSFNSTLCWE